MKNPKILRFCSVMVGVIVLGCVETGYAQPVFAQQTGKSEKKQSVAPKTANVSARVRDLIAQGDKSIEARNAPVARAAFSEALRLDSRSVEAIWGLGRCYSVEGDLDNAEKYARTALNAKPTWGKPYVTLGNVALDRGDLEQAIKHYKRCIELEPNFFLPFMRMGSLYHDTGDWKNAEVWYLAALERNPTSAQSLYSMGQIYRVRTDGKQDMAKAFSFYKRSHKANPDNLDNVRALGFMYHEQGRYSEAKPFYERLYRIFPEDLHVIHVMARISLEEKRYSDAVQFYKKAAVIEPADPHNHIVMALAYAKLGKRAEAKKAAKISLGLGAEVEWAPALYQELGLASGKPR